MAGTATTAERRAAATANFFMIFSFSWCGTTPFGSRPAPLNGVRGCRFNERIIQNGTISLPVLFLQHSLSRPWELIALFQGQKKAAITKIRSEEHTSELQSLMRISYAVFCLKKKKIKNN